MSGCCCFCWLEPWLATIISLFCIAHLNYYIENLSRKELLPQEPYIHVMGLRIFIKYKLNTPFFARESSFRYTFGALEWLLSLVGAFNESLKQPTLQYRINILPEKRYQCDKKLLPHLVHLYGFPPVWALLWVSRDLIVKRFCHTWCTWKAYLLHRYRIPGKSNKMVGRNFLHSIQVYTQIHHFPRRLTSVRGIKSQWPGS